MWNECQRVYSCGFFRCCFACNSHHSLCYKGKEKDVTEALKNKELFGEWTRARDKVGVTLKIRKETFLLNATNIFEDGIRPIADVLFSAIE